MSVEVTADGQEEVQVFDHHSPEYVERHIETFAELRERCPVAHSPMHGGFYVLTRYDDVSAAAHDDNTFSSAWTEDGRLQGLTIPGRPLRHSFIEMDPPESLMYRKALLPLFSPATVKARNGIRAEIVRTAIDEVIESGRCDIVVDFGDRIPAMTTLDLLGLPTDNWKDVVSFFHNYTSAPPEEDSVLSADWLIRYVEEAIAERRREPRDDGLTWIINRKLGDVTISDDEAREAVFLIMIGGFDTTSALLANTFLYLSDHPDARERLIREPELLPSACEEFLRFYSPVLSLSRTVMQECVLSGQALQKNDRVLLAWIAANHDPEVFPDPERVILDRFPNRHQAFGLGTHRCIGSTIARENFLVAVGEVLKRIPDYQVLKDESVRYPSLHANNGWLSMPVTFTPRHRSAAGGS